MTVKAMKAIMRVEMRIYTPMFVNNVIEKCDGGDAIDVSVVGVSGGVLGVVDVDVFIF